MKISKDQAFQKTKHGINLLIYPVGSANMGLVHIQTDAGHFEEFYHNESTFTYYVINGSGSFYLDGESIPVEAGDVITAPPKTKIYYLGSLELILVTTPPWTQEKEVHVRDIEEK